MSAAPSRIPEALDKIAARLGVPVETFLDPSTCKASGHVAALVLDPDGRQLAEAFVVLPPDQRAALSRVARIMAGLCRDAA